MKPYSMPASLLVEELVDRGVELLEDYVYSVYERIERLEPRINAYITIRSLESVLKEAKKKLEEARKEGKLPLAGLLVAVKDNISTEGLRTTCASRILENYTPLYDASVVEALKKAGAVVLGKTNMDEFAMGSTGENSAFGPTRNPWSQSRVPGGSSSGSAAALASGLATLALGSDTGGSIRLPASWTGLYGLKPSYGLVSRYGLISYADSLEQIGPMARSVEDLRLLFKIISFYDSRDSTSIPITYRRRGSSSRGFERIGVVADFLESEAVDPSIKSLLARAERIFERNGLEVVEVSLGTIVVEYALPAYYVIAMAEASSNLARYDCIRYGGCPERIRPWESWREFYSRVRGKYLGGEVKKRIMLGSWILSAGYREKYYIRALKVRRLVKESLEKSLESVDALLAPAAITPPPRIGEVLEDSSKMYTLDLATVVANLAGLPALTLPIGFVGEVPIGVQLVGRHLEDELLLDLGRIVEEETGLSNMVSS